LQSPKAAGDHGRNNTVRNTCHDEGHGKTIIEVQRVDENRIEAIQFMIDNLNSIMTVMKERSTSLAAEWDPQWPKSLQLSHRCVLLARKL